MSSTTINCRVRDVTGQLEKQASVPADVSVAELVDALLPQMNLPRNTSDGEAITYHLRKQSSSEALHGDQTVGQSIQDDDELQILPEIIPGA